LNKSRIFPLIQLSILIVTAGIISIYLQTYADSNFESNQQIKNSNGGKSTESTKIAIVKGALNQNNEKFFSPENVTVPVDSVVAWVNNDEVSHTATAKNGEFDTGLISPSDTASVSISKKGHIPYQCTIHPWMEGLIVVNFIYFFI
jgi:plastocyanin